MKTISLLIGVVGVLLGGLWLVQGLGLVTIPPILCVAECEAITGPSPGWALAGIAMMLAGAVIVFYALKLPRPARRD
ncbi:MAG TPA: hypothetical protein VL147_12155 [Devosia sp.]|nr:hypothetical protein [Devosia sp.]